MQGVIFDIKRFAVHDGPGIRVTVFLKGCPLVCLWCHNPESIDPVICTVSKNVKTGDKIFTDDEVVGQVVMPGELIAEFCKDRVFMEESGGGVTFSGGEPLMQHEFLAEALSLCKQENMHTAVDTSGFAPWKNFEEMIPPTDLFLYDLKLIDDDLHQRFTGCSNKLILENLIRLSAENKCIRIRIPMIPQVTFTDENISGILSFLDKLPSPVRSVDLLPYHNMASHKYRRFGMANRFETLKSLPKEELFVVKQQFETAGYETHIGG